MNRFINYVINLSEKLDLTLKLTYSTYRGWSIKLHEKGYDVPIINVNDNDKEKAFSEAYKLLKEYVKEVKN